MLKKKNHSHSRMRIILSLFHPPPFFLSFRQKKKCWYIWIIFKRQQWYHGWMTGSLFSKLSFIRHYMLLSHSDILKKEIYPSLSRFIPWVFLNQNIIFEGVVYLLMSFWCTSEGDWNLKFGISRWSSAFRVCRDLRENKF